MITHIILSDITYTDNLMEFSALPQYILNLLNIVKILLSETVITQSTCCVQRSFI